MSLLQNKHVITALIVAPILAIGSYYLVDLLVREQPQKPIAGQVYKLIAQPNCQFSSGLCELSNGNLKTTIIVSKTKGQQGLILTANKVLQQVNVGFVTSDGHEVGPLELALNDAQDQWFTVFDLLADATTTLRVAIRANDAFYLSETTMGFSRYETSFEQDFRQ